MRIAGLSRYPSILKPVRINGMVATDPVMEGEKDANETTNPWPVGRGLCCERLSVPEVQTRPNAQALAQ